MASVWKLPVVFLCQNNQYAEHTTLAAGTSVTSIAERAAGYEMPGVSCDGLDPKMLYQTMDAAVARARAGDGHTLVDTHTYRLQGHISGIMETCSVGNEWVRPCRPRWSLSP